MTVFRHSWETSYDQVADDCRGVAIRSRGKVLCSVGNGNQSTYLRNLLKNMCLAQLQDLPVYEDHAAFIKWIKHVIGGRKRVKDIDIRKHFAPEVVQKSRDRLT